jgi:hypothetical protein
MAEPLHTFLDKAQKEVGEMSQEQRKNEPRVPFQTAMRLTADQETRMLDEAFRRFKQLKTDMGRDEAMNPSWWTTVAAAPSTALASQGYQQVNTFLAKRCRYDATFMNDMTWRPYTMGTNNIFLSSNLVVPLSRRIARQMIAKAKNSLFGSQPWISVDPCAGQGDDSVEAELAERIERFCRFKLDLAESADDKGRAVDRAIVLGECVVKTSYVVRDQIFDVEAMALVDVEGVTIKGADGNNITPDDQWDEQDDGLGNKKTVLHRDGVTEQPLAPVWQKVQMNRRQVLFEGAKGVPIYYKDILITLTASDPQTAPTCVHCYDKPVMEFVDLVVKRGMVDDSTPQRKLAAQKMLALVQQMASNSNQPKAAVDQDTRPGELANNAALRETQSPVSEFCEFYMWYDANDDGIDENIMLIADRNSQAPIFYDHVANVTTDGLRPLEVIRINPIEGRWYGMGVMELFESYQTWVDLMVNRWNFSQSRSGRIDLWTPTATLEGDRDPNLKLNWGGTYTRKPGMKKEDVIECVYLDDIKFDQIEKQLQLALQLAANESGVSNANDAQTAGLKSSELATGVINIQQSGDELFKPILADLKSPMRRQMNREVAVTLANMNPEEVFTYLEGDTMQMDKLTPDDVRGLKFHVTVELTSDKNQQIIQQSAQAWALVEKFYTLDPQIQARVAPFARKQLHALDPLCNPETTIVPLGMAPGLPSSPPAAGAAGAAAPGAPGAAPDAEPMPGATTPFSAQLTQAQKPDGGIGDAPGKQENNGGGASAQAA